MRTIYSEKDVDRIEDEVLRGGEGSGSGSGSGSNAYDLNIPFYTDECALFALTKAKIVQMNHSYGNFNATDYYNSLKSFATDLRDEEGLQLYTGGAMNRDVILMTGSAFNLFEYNQEFDDESREDFFSDKEDEYGHTIPGDYSTLRIIHILKKDLDTNEDKDHYATVRENGIDTKNKKIHYTDHDDGGVVSFDKILGAFY